MSDVSGEFLESVRASKPEPETTTEQLAEIEGQAEPVQVCEGRWRTRGGEVKDVTAIPTDHDDFSPAYPWWDGDVMTWANDGRFAVHENAMDLVKYLGPIEAEIGWQAEAIGRLQGEAHNLNMEIGGLERQLMQRDARIRDLETINTAQKEAVERANRETEKLALQWAAVKEELKIAAAVCQQLQIELDAAQQVPADTPELRRANDKLAQLEVLQPMAAACSTAQTMVRDMLGHMRCLLALHHTTDRSNFCTLLESILEVFDDVECDDDETSEAEQG
jgi:hypothetical protein